MSCSGVRVDAEWVQAHLGVPGVVVIEVGEDTAFYGKGHIRGAVKIDLAGLQDPARCGRAGFEALLSERGIASEDMVILYSGSNRAAATAYWHFRSHGHQTVRLLDGGRKRWERDSRTFVTEVPDRPRAAYRVPGAARPRIATWPLALVRGLWNAITKPADQVLRVASTRVPALLTSALSGHEDHLRDHRAHGIAGSRKQDPGRSTGLSPTNLIP